MMQAAERLSSFLVAKCYIKEEEHHIYSYCFEVVFSAIAFWGSMFLFALLTGTLVPTAFYLASFCLFRHVAGGYHASTHLRCFMMSVVFYTIFFLTISFIPTHLHLILSFFFIVVSYAAFLAFAPLDHENNPFTPEQKLQLRRKLLILMLFFLLVIAILTVYHYSAIIFYLACGCFQSGTAILLAEKQKRKDGRNNG